MAATISSSGTWTALPGLVGMDARANTPSINKIDLESLKGIYGVVHPEVMSFVQLMADAYSLTFWQAAGLLGVLYTALMNSEGPQQQSQYTP